MVRVRTLWPHHVGGITLWSPKHGHWRVSNGGKHWHGEGVRPGKMGEDWAASPARTRWISWWRKNRLAARRDIDRACWRGNRH